MHMVLRRRLLRLQTAYRTGVNTNSASPPRRISQAHILTYTATTFHTMIGNVFND
jgi:hypothetical protein